MSKELLFSVTREHLDFQFFRGSGNGGQKRNKTSSCCRVIHRPSGAVGECREERMQSQNRKIAFRRMAETKKFQMWLRMTAADKILGRECVEREVDKMMDEKNLKIETYDPEE